MNVGGTATVSTRLGRSANAWGHTFAFVTTRIGDTPPMLRRGLAPAALVIAVAVATWLVSGVGAADILRFLGYEICFIAIPGAALLWAIRGSRSGFLVTIALGWPLGQTFEILAFSASAATGFRALFLLYPVLAIAASGLAISRRRDAMLNEHEGETASALLLWAAACALSLGLVYIAYMFLPEVPLPTSATSVAYPIDFPFFMGLIGQALHHWPTTSPGLSGVPLHYEWFVFFHMAAVTQVTHVAIPTVALRLDYAPTMVVIGCQLLVVGRSLARSAWVGVLAIVVVFLLGPLDFTTDPAGVSAPFYERFNFHLWASWTFPFGLMFLLALVYLINKRFELPAWSRARNVGSWSLIALLMAGASGAKATILPVVVAGLGLYTLTIFVVRQRVPWNAIALLGIGILIFAVTFFVVYGGGAPGTGFDPFVSLGGTLPAIAAEGITSPTVRHAVLPFAYTAGVAGVLLPLAGALYMLRRRHRGELARYGFCIALFLAGLVIANLVHQIAYSEQYFLDTGFVAGAVVAAGGLRLAWLDAGSALPMARRHIVIALGASLALLVVLIGVTSKTMNHDDALTARYIVLGAASIALVAAWTLRLRSRHRDSSGVLALALIPLLAASALTSPLLLAPKLKRVLDGLPVTVTEPDPQTVWGLTPGLLAALQWLQDHSPVDAVLAVSNHWTNPRKTDAGYYYYSAFSERQVFVEAYSPIRYGITTGLATPEGANFALRQRLNNQVFDGASLTALKVLTGQYSVRFLLVDRIHGSVDPAVLKLGRIVFSNHDATVVAVG